MNRLDEMIWAEEMLLRKKQIYGLTPNEVMQLNELREEIAVLMIQEKNKLDEMMKQEDYYYDYQGIEVFPWDDQNSIR